MKKILLLLLALALCMGVLVGCDTEAPSESVSSSSSATESSSSEESSSSTGENIQAPNQTKLETKQTEKYYRQISSQYSITVAVDSSLHKDGKVFIDGIFEMNQQSQYKILSQHSELQAFSLLNHDEAEPSLFEENCVIAILSYHRGPTGDAKTPSGFHSLKFNEFEGSQITMDLFYTSLLTTEDVADVYSLYFVIVPKSEIEQITPVGNIAINAKVLAQYEINTYATETTVEKAETHYVSNLEAMRGLELYDTISTLPSLSPPCLVIHLSEAIETDFIVNGFKYENGEIYITIQIFEKSEMKDLYGFPINLILVSLESNKEGLDLNVPDNISTDSPVNIMLEYVS